MQNTMEITPVKSLRTGTLIDRKYWEFFIPTILMAMTLTMSIVVDSIIVGNMLGASALAAVNLVMPVIMLYNTVAVCLGLGSATIISVAKGKRQDDHANIVFTTAVVGLVFVGGMLLIGQELFVDQLTALLTREESLRPLVKSYLHMLIYGTVLIVTIPGMAYCLRVDGRVKLASTILIVSNLVNLVLDLVYMGPLKMGIAGSSLATVSGYVVGGLFLLLYVFSSTRTLRFKTGLLTDIKTLCVQFVKIVATGFPAATGSILITIKILCVNHIILAVAGKSGMVAFSVCLSCLSFVSMFISGAAQAMTPIVGVLFGERDYRGIYFVFRRAFITIMIAGVATTALFELFPGIIMQLFGVHHAADIQEGIPAIRIFSLSLCGTSITFLCMYYYMTVGQTRLSTAISFVQGAAVIPMAFFLSQIFGSAGVWGAFSVTEIITILMISCVCLLKIRSSPDRFSNVLLLDKTVIQERKRFEISSGLDTSGRKCVLESFIAFMKRNDLAATVQNQVITVTQKMLEELAVLNDSKGKSGRQVDIMLDLYPEKSVILFRDTAGESVTKEQLMMGADGNVVDYIFSRAIGFNNYTMVLTAVNAR